MKVVFLGGGNMANALIGGLLKRGITADNLSVSNAVRSLRSIGDADWPDIVARTSTLMQLLLTFLKTTPTVLKTSNVLQTMTSKRLSTS